MSWQSQFPRNPILYFILFYLVFGVVCGGLVIRKGKRSTDVELAMPCSVVKILRLWLHNKQKSLFLHLNYLLGM